MKILKDHLKKWNRDVFGILDLQIDNIVAELNNLDLTISDDLVARSEIIKSLTAEFWKQLRAKESILCQN